MKFIVLKEQNPEICMQIIWGRGSGSWLDELQAKIAPWAPQSALQEYRLISHIISLFYTIFSVGNTSSGYCCFFSTYMCNSHFLQCLLPAFIIYLCTYFILACCQSGI